MIRLKPHGFYDHFPDHHPVDGEPFFNLYTDRGLNEPIEENAIALLLEPKTIDPVQYSKVKTQPEKFKYIFSHDEDLIALRNGYYFNWGNVWSASPEAKTKNISLISSFKEMCPLHVERKKLAKYYKDSEKVDVYGDFESNKEDPTKWVTTHDAHAAYRFAIVIENEISPWWFTEKILNCFANKTVPIYMGASGVSNWFLENGIIRAKSIDDIKRIVEKLDCEAEYEKRLPAINVNYRRVEPFRVDWRDRFIRRIEKLEGMK